jgi:hypothetical protein
VVDYDLISRYPSIAKERRAPGRGAPARRTSPPAPGVWETMRTTSGRALWF